MLYDNYQNKIAKIARVLSKLVRMLPIILAVLAVITAGMITSLAFKGTVTDLEIPSEIEYGSSFHCESSAFWSDVHYEYSTDNGKSWQKECPHLPGTYQVRACGKSIFGNPRYSDIESFTVVPKKATVSVAESSIEYGDSLSAAATLSYKDRLVCDDFVYVPSEKSSAGAENVAIYYNVTPALDKIKILDEEGNDITFAYSLEVAASEVAVLKRGITVTVEDSSRVYDGLSFSFDGYELSGGSLAEGDVLIATFTAELTDVGTVPNNPTLKVVSSNGEDRTLFYYITSVFGSLTVEKRPVIITTQSGAFLYQGEPIDCSKYTVNDETPLAENHQLVIRSGITAINFGTYKNTMTFDVVSEDGQNKTENYALFVNEGEIQIAKKHLLVTTVSCEWVYDGRYHDEQCRLTVEGLVEGHQYTREFELCQDAGSYSNWVSIVTITDRNGNNVYDNYSIESSFGTVTILPRPLEVTFYSETWVYDGKLHAAPGCSGRGIAEGHFVFYQDLPKIRDVGTVANTSTITIATADPSVYPQTPDLTSNYDITLHEGTLTVTPRPIDVYAGNETWVYDGRFHQSLGTITNLVEGHHFKYVDVPQICDVGDKVNVFSIVIYDAHPSMAPQAEDVTSNYDITYHDGMLTVTPRPIMIKPIDAEKVYDDSPLVATQVELHGDSPYDLVEGQRIMATFSGSITDVGETASQIATYQIVDSNTNDVSYNYDVTPEEGTLLVLPRQITVYTESAEKLYDRTPLIHKVFGVYPDQMYGLVAGHTLSLHIVGSQTEIGESENDCDPKKTSIRSATRDVTRNYEIQYDLGTLTVKPQAVISVTSASDWKYYDGQPLVNGHYDEKILEGSLRTDWGHQVFVDISGTITNVGNVSNRTSVSVLDSFGRDVSDYYVIICTEGTLEVRSSEETPEDPPHMVIGQIQTDLGGVIYLREDSFGDYDGRNWNVATPYWKTLPGGISYNYLTSLALAGSGQQVSFASIENLAWMMLPYYMDIGGDYELQESDTVYSGTRKDFMVPYYSMPSNKNGYESLKGNLGEWASYEEDYRDFVYQMYLTIDDETRAFMQSIITEQGFDIHDPKVIAAVAHYIQNAAQYDLEFDPAMEQEENVAIAFLSTYKKGVCRHYASAATLLFRALGIPARYVTGFMVETVAGEYVDITTPGHAWVEVYVDGVGWVMVEVTGSMGEGGSGGEGSGEGGGEGGGEGSGEGGGEGGELPVPGKPEIIRVYLYQLQKYYDGTPLYFEQDDYEIIELPDGVELVLNLNISLTDVGSLSLSEINENLSDYVTYRVYRDGKDVTAEHVLFFDTFDSSSETYLPIRVDKRSIVVTSASQTKVDDGTPLENHDVFISKGSLAEGHRLEVNVIGFIDIAGSVENEIASAVILDEYGMDVSSNYEIECIHGTLTILPSDE